MTQVATNLRNTQERARQLRFEPVGSISETNVQKAIEQAATQPVVLPKTSVTFAASPYTVLATDTYLAIDASGGAVTINLQAGSARTLDLEIKDVTGDANANNISVVANGTDTVDGLATYPINADFGGVKLRPQTNGYAVVP